MTAAVAHRVLADYVLAGAFILFSLTLIAAVAWSERDRRRAARDDAPGLRLVRPFESTSEHRW
jgi:hypothetical protein